MKTAIIIGATYGIGRELAKKLTFENYSVGIVARTEGLLEEIKSDDPSKYFIQQLDIIDSENISPALDGLANQLGGVELIILCAGFGKYNPSLQLSTEIKTIDTNVTGFTTVVNWACNYFQDLQRGHLIVLTSVAGLHGSINTPAYNASKAFQMNYLEGLRDKMAINFPSITITDIRPGFIGNEEHINNDIWILPINKAVKLIYKAILNKPAIVYIPGRWKLLAIFHRLIPKKFYYRVYHH
jgi:short-subunit dehydrogenase